MSAFFDFLFDIYDYLFGQFILFLAWLAYH